MRQRTVIIAYWTLVVLLTATVLCFLEYPSFSFIESLLLGILLLPAALIIKYTIPSILQQHTIRKAIDICLLTGTVYVIGALLFIIGSAMVSHEYEMYRGVAYSAVPVPVNPAFPLIIVSAAGLFCAGDWFLVSYLRRKMPQEPVSITFTSDRRPVTILQSEILYIESNDDETWVHATDGQKYRNKTPISQWENLLGIDFQRIHRSFLVARTHIGTAGYDTVTLDSGLELPVSRKYRGCIRTDQCS